MNRRTFVRGAFGFVALATLGGAGISLAGMPSTTCVTPEFTDLKSARGPAMVAGIELTSDGDVTHASYNGTHLFDVDSLGAELVRLADGSMSIDELADAASMQLKPADVASFFVTLGKAGYLANTVLVNLTETTA